jgi:hypothetical protein
MQILSEALEMAQGVSGSSWASGADPISGECWPGRPRNWSQHSGSELNLEASQPEQLGAGRSSKPLIIGLLFPWHCAKSSTCNISSSPHYGAEMQISDSISQMR